MARRVKESDECAVGKHVSTTLRSWSWSADASATVRGG